MLGPRAPEIAVPGDDGLGEIFLRSAPRTDDDVQFIGREAAVFRNCLALAKISPILNAYVSAQDSCLNAGIPVLASS